MDQATLQKVESQEYRDFKAKKRLRQKDHLLFQNKIREIASQIENAPQPPALDLHFSFALFRQLFQEYQKQFMARLMELNSQEIAERIRIKREKDLIRKITEFF